jgi:hypothetical protein
VAKQLTVLGEHIKVARVLAEDDRWLTLEVAKSDDETFHLDEDTPDRFFTILFFNAEKGSWVPWEDTDG